MDHAPMRNPTVGVFSNAHILMVHRPFSTQTRIQQFKYREEMSVFIDLSNVYPYRHSMSFPL